MAGIAGIVNRDGAPCDRALVAAMARAIAFRGPAGTLMECDGPAGFATLFGHGARQPQPGGTPSSRSRVLVAFDGRIDNRAELERRVGARAGTLTDGELVAALHARVSDEAFARIEGDFAVALWDRATRHLVCARDTWGVRPFVYCEFGSAFAFASEVVAFRAVAGFDVAPDEAMVAEHLALDIRSGDRTLYRGVRRLEPATVLTVADSRTSRRTYWSYDAEKVLRLHGDSTYAARFLDLFEESVRVRLDPTAPTGCELSGGIDSSTVTAVAGQASGRAIDAISLVFPGLSCDESGRVDDVARFTGARSHRVSPHVRSADDLLAEAEELGDAPDLPHGAMHRSVYDRASDRGIATLLTGLGGDDWFQGSVPAAAIADALYEGRVFDVLRASAPSVIVDALRLSVSESPAGPPIRSILGPFRGRRPGLERPPWITSDLWAGSGAADIFAHVTPPRRGSPARLATLRNGAAAWPVWGTERAERVAARRGVELRHPFLDRRVRAFGLALPEDQRVRDGLTRFVVRNAMRGLLPDSILSRRSKTSFAPVMVAALGGEGVGEMLRNLSIEARGWVDGGWLRARHALLAGRDDVTREDELAALWALAMTISLEAWHRSLTV